MITIKDKLYITIVDHQDFKVERQLIYCTSNTFNSWTVHDPPEGLEGFGLTSYHSQLLVVGGKERGKVTNKVWTSDNATDWQLSLPPMPNKRWYPLATNTGPSHECVVVAGGSAKNHKILTKLEVLLEKQWFTVPTSLQRPTHPRLVSVYNGVVYFSIGSISSVVTCPVESLLAACTQSHDVRLDMQKKQISLSTMKQGYLRFGQITISENQLYMLYRMDTGNTPAPIQYVYAGDLPKRVEIEFVITLHTNEFLVATRAHRRGRCKVSKGSIRSEGRGEEIKGSILEKKYYNAAFIFVGCQYNVDDQFSISALHKLEAAGIRIPVLSSLAPLYKELASTLDIPQAEIVRKRQPGWTCSCGHVTLTQQQLIDLDIVMERWLSGKGPLLPTWKSLYEILRQFGLKVLSQQTAEYLSGM